VVFQLCGQRPVAELAAELAAKLNLGVETRPPEEQIAAAKEWLAQRRALLVLDDIWENDVMALVVGPPVSLLCTSRRRSLPVGFSGSFAERQKLFARRGRVDFSQLPRGGNYWEASRCAAAVCGPSRTPADCHRSRRRHAAARA
jgi:hypothetical protein